MQKFFDNVADPQGNVIPRASVAVKDSVTGILSTIYSDNSFAPKTNPITCDDQGYFEFYAANGRYTLTVTGGALTTRVVQDVLLEDITGTGADLVGFTPAGPSAVPRSVQDRLRDLQSVFDWFSAAQVADWRAGSASLDVTSAMTTALSECTSGVWLPDGAGLITSLAIPSGKAMVGAGSKRVTLKQKASTTGTAVIVNSTSQACTVVGFQIDGNKANQSVANTGFALVSAGSPPSGTHFPGGNHRFDDIYAVNCKGRGIDLDGPGGVLSVGKLYTYQCDGDGIYVNVQDSMFEELDSGAAGLHGIHFGTGGYNNRVAKAKAWFSGSVDSTTAGDGFFCEGWYNQIGVTELQDCGRNGLNLSAASNNIFAAVHVESAGRIFATSYGLVLSDSRGNTIVSQQHNRTANVGFLAALHMVSGGSGAFYNDITIGKSVSTLTDTVFDDATFQPARNYIRITNVTNDDGPRISSNVNVLYKLNLIGTNAKLFIDTGASSVTTKWSAAPNGNDSVSVGYPNCNFLHFSGSHGTNPGWTTVNFGGGVAGAKWRLQNMNGTDTSILIEGSEAAGVRRLGFFGAAAVAKPSVTGSRAANAALASLLTQLASLGLVTDSTTA